MVAYERLHQSFTLNKFELIAIISSILLYIFGFLLVVSTVILDYVRTVSSRNITSVLTYYVIRHLLLNMTYRWERRRAIQMQDEMMLPPRCKQKAEELGCSPMDWKDYFARDEPFIDADY